MRNLILLVVLFLSFSGIAQTEAIETFIQFSKHVTDKEMDEALAKCSDFSKKSYFANKKHLKFCRYEFFKDIHNVSVAEKRKNEVRLAFKSGKDSTSREVFLKEVNSTWYMITKIELLHIKNFYMNVEKDTISVRRGWNTASAKRIAIPFDMHVHVNSEDLYIIGLEINPELEKRILAKESLVGATSEMWLFYGNVIPLKVKQESQGKATIREVQYNPNDIAENSYTIDASFETKGGFTGEFRMKIVLDE